VGLEDEVRKLIDDAIERAVPMLESATGEKDPAVPLTLPEAIRVQEGHTTGLTLAALRLAREIDEIRSA
jgi:hypothetical protein